jgi:hypothetical protein
MSRLTNLEMLLWRSARTEFDMRLDIDVTMECDSGLSFPKHFDLNDQEAEWSVTGGEIAQVRSSDAINLDLTSNSEVPKFAADDRQINCLHSEYPAMKRLLVFLILLASLPRHHCQ